MCFVSILLVLQLSVQAQLEEPEAAAERTDTTLFFPIVLKAPEPPTAVEVAQFNSLSLSTCGVSAMTHAGDSRLFVAQQDGLIVILTEDGTVLWEPFIDLSSQVTQACSEQRPNAGLLGLAFHPNYSSNGQFFVTYTRQSDEAIVLSRFEVSNDPNRADLTSEQVMLVVEKPSASAELTHNGGALTFGPAGHLFVALGDGDTRPGLSDALPGDANNHGQRTDTLLGKVLRLDVDGSGGAAPDCGNAGYRIPSQNGFANGAGGACDEIWGVGVRAPWGMTYDALANQLIFVDSAEYQRNEINRVPNGATAPNFGWRCAEGTVNHAGQPHVTNCPSSDTLTMPTIEYGLGEGCRVVGGHVHGSEQATFNNQYLFTDACQSGQIGRIDLSDPDLPLVWMTVTNLPVGISWNASGSDWRGNVYLSEFSFSPSGPINIYQVIDPQLNR